MDDGPAAAADGQRRRDELETKIESYRILQERRRLRLEQVRNPKDASTLMTELDLAQSVMAKEENDWVRSAEMVMQLEVKVKDEERSLEAVEAAQAPERAEVARAPGGAGSGTGCRDARARGQRRPDGQVDPQPVRPPSANPVRRCGRSPGRWRVRRCHTTVPLNRRSQIRAGHVIDACEACGAILYPSETAGSALMRSKAVHSHGERLSRPYAAVGGCPAAESGSRLRRWPPRSGFRRRLPHSWSSAGTAPRTRPAAILRPLLADLSDPLALAGMAEAVEIIAAAVRAGDRILVHGDYDVDGQCSSALLTRALARGRRRCACLPAPSAPRWLRLRPAGLEAARAVDASLIITCDCGITAPTRCSAAREAGIGVIVTDHHLPGVRSYPPHWRW